MARKSESEVARSDQRRERRYQEEKQTLRAQMAVDDMNRQILQDLKDEEKKREERALYESFRELKVQEQQLKAAKSEEMTRLQEQNQQPHDRGLKPSIAMSSGSSERKTRPKPKKKVSFASDLASPKQPTTSLATPVVGDSTEPQEPPVLELSADGSFDLPVTPIAAALVNELSKSSVNSDNDDNNDTISAASHTLDSTQSSRRTDSAHSSAPLAKSDAKEALATPRVARPSAIPAPVKAIPEPRAAVRSEICFTPRVFPTPSRESKAAEEEDWLLKNRKHLNKHKGLHGAGSYDISESDRELVRRRDPKLVWMLVCCCVLAGNQPCVSVDAASKQPCG